MCSCDNSWQQLKGRRCIQPVAGIASIFNPCYITVHKPRPSSPPPVWLPLRYAAEAMLALTCTHTHTHTHTHTQRHILSETHLLTPIFLSSPLGCSAGFLMSVRNWGSGNEKNKSLKIAFWKRSGQKIAFHVPLQHALLFLRCLLPWRRRRRKSWAENTHDNWLISAGWSREQVRCCSQTEMISVLLLLLFYQWQQSEGGKVLIVRYTSTTPFIC